MLAGQAPPRRPLRRGLLRAAAAGLGLALLVRGAVVEPHLVTTGAMAPTLLPGDQVLVSRLAYRLRLPFTGLVLLERSPPRRGDLVVFPDPTDPARRLVKRVVGLPGEVIELREQVLLVDGVEQQRQEEGALEYAEPGDAGGPAQEATCRRWREFLVAGPVLRPGAPDPALQAASAGPQAAPGAGARPVAVRGGGHQVLQCRRARAGRREGPYGPVRPGHLFVLGDNRDRSADSRAGWEVPAAEVIGRGARVGWSWGAGGWWPWGGAGVRIDRLFKPVE